MRFAVIMAGGGGTRLWPASRRGRPKQLLSLGTGDESLLAATARRLRPLVGDSGTLVVTAAEQVDGASAELPGLPAANLITEPVGRNTAAALGLAAVHLMERHPALVMAAIPADQHIADEAGFARTLEIAFAVAEASDVIVTIGLSPTRPETGYGYLQLGDDRGDGSRRVARFVEKPDAQTAERYVASGDYLWNGGMFIVRAARLWRDIETHLPDTARGLERVRSALREGGANAAAAAAREVYPTLPSISIDYGVMERAADVVTVPGNFGWNDVGAWTALADYRDADAHGNVVHGDAALIDAHRNIVVSDDGALVAVVGVDDVVVVRAGNAVLVVPRARAQDVRDVVQQLKDRNLDDYL